MTGVLAGLALALAASVAQSTGFLSQHIGAAERPPVSLRYPLVTLRSLAGSGWWLIGAGLGLAGFALHVGALSLAPLSLAQAFLAGGLVFAAPIAARGFGHRLTVRERWSVLGMAAALAILPVGLAHSGAHAHFAGATLGSYLGAGLVVATLGGLRRTAPALALTAGVFYAMLDTTLKALTGIAREGGLRGLLTSPWWLAAAVSAAAAFFCFQRALQIGRALSVIALMEAAAETASIGAGFAVFGDSLGHSPALAALHLAAFVVVAGAAWALAPTPHRLRPD